MNLEIAEMPEHESKNDSMSDIRVYFLNDGGGYLTSSEVNCKLHGILPWADINRNTNRFFARKLLTFSTSTCWILATCIRTMRE